MEFLLSSLSSYCNPALLSSPTEEDRDRIYGWTLDTGHWPATRRHLRRSSSSYRSNTITIKLQQWHEPSQLLAKSSLIFFQHQHGRRISPGIPHYQYCIKSTSIVLWITNLPKIMQPGVILSFSFGLILILSIFGNPTPSCGAIGVSCYMPIKHLFDVKSWISHKF